MNANNPYAKQAGQYLKNNVETASPDEVLIMLYDGAIRFLLIARKALEENNVEKSHNHLIKAQNIVLEFMNSLDMDMGGEIAVNLYRLYEYLHYRLVQANIKKDVAMIDEVLDHLRKLKETWEEASRIAKRERETPTDASSSEPLRA